MIMQSGPTLDGMSPDKWHTYIDNNRRLSQMTASAEMKTISLVDEIDSISGIDISNAFIPCVLPEDMS